MPDPDLSSCATNVILILRSEDGPLDLASIQSQVADQFSDDDVVAALEELESHENLVIKTLGPHWSAYPNAFGQ
jgi:formate dehydrogenase assembly factor FdhD